MGEINFTKKELERYSRHLIIPEFNISGQKKLKGSKVLVVGTGGLGAPLIQYLSAAGVGTLGIVDYDVVDESNLHRQVLFSTQDVGRSKVEVVKERIEAQNPYITINCYNTRLTSDNALTIINGYDVVADGTDNFPTRYLVNDSCVLLNKVNVYASIFRFDGQVSVFNFVDKEGNRGPNYRDLFPSPPPPGMVPSCAEGGVLGVLPGIIGSLQASEVIKVITGIGEPLTGRIFVFDALTFDTRILQFKRDENNALNGKNPTIKALIDYEDFCGFNDIPEEEVLKNEVTVQQLAEWKARGENFQLIDVRELYEYEIANLGGVLIPLSSIEEQIDRINTDTKVIVHCRSGKRSADAIRILQDRHGFKNLYNLKGGILAYADEIDQSLAKY